MKANAPLKILALFSKRLRDTNKQPNIWKSFDKCRPDGKRGRAGDQNSLINLLNGHTGSCRAGTRPWLCHSGLSDESGACISELSERANTLYWQKKKLKRAGAHTHGDPERTGGFTPWGCSGPFKSPVAALQTQSARPWRTVENISVLITSGPS